MKIKPFKVVPKYTLIQLGTASSKLTFRVVPGAKIQIRDDGAYLEEMSDGSQKQLEKATITLADCLACSGCITSAESVLIEQQSSQELYR